MVPVYKFALREDIRGEKQFLPTRAEPKATGWDVRAAMHDKQSITVAPFQYAKIPLGFRAFCPDGWWLSLKPRSSTFAKKNLHALYGTIDETFEGEMVFACQYIPSMELFELNYFTEGNPTAPQRVAMFDASKLPSLTINFGEAIGQLIPIQRQEMEVVEMSNDEYDADSKERDAVRKAGGFGSTGN
jgi:dUTPase